MDKYIGIDVHAASCTIAVVDARGKQTGSHVVATNGQEIVECLRAIPGQRHVCFEEGTQSGWLFEILEPHAVEVVVAGVGAGSRGPKDDKRDAFGLAEDLRQGAIKTRVFKNGGPYKALRELARTHRMVVLLWSGHRDALVLGLAARQERTVAARPGTADPRTQPDAQPSSQSHLQGSCHHGDYPASRRTAQRRLPALVGSGHQTQSRQGLAGQKDRHDHPGDVEDRGGIRLEQAQQNGFAIGRPRRCELVGHGITDASTSRHGPTTKVRGRVSIVPLDSRIFSKFPSIGYAPSEYRTKPWPQEVLIEGWFPLLAREQNGFRVDGTTDSSTPAPRSLRQRNCGSRHTPLSGDRRIDHLFLTTSIYSRTRVDAGCHNNRIARRWVIVLLDILFHRRRKKRPFAFTKSHPQEMSDIWMFGTRTYTSKLSLCPEASFVFHVSAES